MDQVLADTLTANLKTANTLDDKVGALTLATIAMVDCQRKTADRVKELHSAKDRAVWVGRTIWGFAAGGGFAVLGKALKALGVF